MFADFGQHIGIGDFGRNEGIEGQFREFGVDEVHTGDGRVVIAQAPVDSGQHIPGARVGFADEDKVRVEHIADHAAQGDELGVIAQAEILSAALAGMGLQGRQDFSPRGSRHHGTRKDNQMIAVLVPQGLADAFGGCQDVAQREGPVLIARRGHDDEGGLACPYRRAIVTGSRKAFMRGLDERLQPRFVNRRFPCVDQADGTLVQVHADDLVPLIGQHSRQGGSQFAQTDDRDAHFSSFYVLW